MRKLVLLSLCMLFILPATASAKAYYSHQEVLSHVLGSYQMSNLLEDNYNLTRGELSGVFVTHLNESLDSVFKVDFKYEFTMLNSGMLAMELERNCFVSAYVHIEEENYQAKNSVFSSTQLSLPRFTKIECTD